MALRALGRVGTPNWNALQAIVESLVAVTIVDGDARHRPVESAVHRLAKRRDAPSWALRCLAKLRAARGALRLAQEAISRAELRAEPGSLEMLRIAYCRAKILGDERRGDECLAELRAIVEVSRGLDDPATLAVALEGYAFALQLFGGADDALDVAHEALALAESSKALARDALAVSAAMIHCDRLEFVEARRLLASVSLRSAPPRVRLRHSFTLASMAIYQRRPDALRRLRALVRQARALGLMGYVAYFSYDLALTALDQSDLDEALSAAREAERVAKAEGLQAVAVGAGLVGVVATAMQGSGGRALSRLRAMRFIEFDAQSSSFTDGLRALAYMKIAEHFPTRDKSVLLRLATVCRQRFDARGPRGVRFSEVSVFTAVLSRLLGECEREEQPVRVQGDGSLLWIGGTKVSLVTRPTLMRILAHLATGRRTAAELIEAGWPNDRSTQSSLSRRLRVAIHTLRRSGLGTQLTHDRGRYALDPRVQVELGERLSTGRRRS